MNLWKYVKWSLITLAVMILLLSIYAYPLLTQESDTHKIMAAALKLEWTDQKLVKFNDRPKRYLLPAQTQGGPFFQMMKKNGWKLQDQLGAGLIFTKGKENTLAVKRMWTRRYLIITQH